jgi:hypothetical protein
VRISASFLGRPDGNAGRLAAWPSRSSSGGRHARPVAIGPVQRPGWRGRRRSRRRLLGLSSRPVVASYSAKVVWPTIIAWVVLSIRDTPRPTGPEREAKLCDLQPAPFGSDVAAIDLGEEVVQARRGFQVWVAEPAGVPPHAREQIRTQDRGRGVGRSGGRGRCRPREGGTLPTLSSTSASWQTEYRRATR